MVTSLIGLLYKIPLDNCKNKNLQKQLRATIFTYTVLSFKQISSLPLISKSKTSSKEHFNHKKVPFPVTIWYSNTTE